MIPKILHQIWLTGELPEKFWQWRLSWMYYNPDWTFKLWTLADFLDCYGKNMSNKLYDLLHGEKLCYVLKTDILRWLCLYYEGGVYADTDVECLFPFEALLNYKSFAGTSYPPNGIGNATIGAVAQHPLMMDIAERTADRILSDIDVANATVVEFGVNLAGKLLEKADKIFPVYAFYPTWCDNFTAPDRTNAKTKHHRSYSIHHWTGVDKGGWVDNTILKKKCEDIGIKGDQVETLDLAKEVMDYLIKEKKLSFPQLQR